MTLGELITARKRALRQSYEELAQRARRQGHTITDTTICDLAKDDVNRAVTPSTLRGLSAALQVSLPRVKAAWEETSGLPGCPDMFGRSDVEAYRSLTEGLSKVEIEQVLTLVETIVGLLSTTRTN